MKKTIEKSEEVTVDLQPLAKGWVWSNLGEIGLTRLGKTPGKADYRDTGAHKIIKFRDVDESGQVDWDSDKKGHVDSSPEVLRTLKEIQDGDVLVTASAHMSDHIGKKVGIVRNIPRKYQATYVVGEILQIRTKDDVDPRWVLYYLRSSQGYKAIQRRVHGVHLIASRARNIEIPLVPFKQSQVLIAEIEKQFSRLDDAVASLKRVKANLKRYKAAVLKAAVEGRIVETEAELARRECRSYETGAQLLQRILETRRSQWKGKGKYKEPAEPDTTDLPELPEGWVWAVLGQLVWSVKDGPHFSPKYADEGIPFISGGNVRPEGIDFSQTKFITPELHAELSKRCKPELGDLLYTKGGTTGIARVNTESREFNVWVHVAVLKLMDSIDPFYLQHALNSPHCYEQSQKYTHGVGNQDLGLTRMVWITVPLPSSIEQQRIVAEIDRRQSLIREVESQVDVNLKRSERLRQSVLASAFCGN